MQRMIRGIGILLIAVVTAGCTTVVYRKPLPPPLPLQVEAQGAAPYREAVWIPGRWAWRARLGEYVWVPGHWQARRYY